MASTVHNPPGPAGCFPARQPRRVDATSINHVVYLMVFAKVSAVRPPASSARRRPDPLSSLGPSSTPVSDLAPELNVKLSTHLVSLCHRPKCCPSRSVFRGKNTHTNHESLSLRDWRTAIPPAVAMILAEGGWWTEASGQIIARPSLQVPATHSHAVVYRQLMKR